MGVTARLNMHIKIFYKLKRKFNYSVGRGKYVVLMSCLTVYMIKLCDMYYKVMSHCSQLKGTFTCQPLKLLKIHAVFLFFKAHNTLVIYWKLYLFYNDYETSYTTYINHVRWHRCLRSNGLRVGGNRRKPTCLTWLPHDHLTCRSLVSNPGLSGERRVR